MGFQESLSERRRRVAEIQQDVLQAIVTERERQGLVSDDPNKYVSDGLESELAQVAAVCVAWLEHIYWNKQKTPSEGG